jgi:DNA-binding CsgD family transcriptional regulator
MQADYDLSACETQGQVAAVSHSYRQLKPRRRSRRAEDIRLQTLSNIAAALLESDKRARIIIDSSWRLVLANNAARQLISDSNLLQLKGAKIECTHKKLEHELTRVLSEDGCETSFSLRVNRRTETVVIRALPVGSSTNTCALIDLSVATEVRLRQQFGLTPAEAEIARAIFHGLSLVKIAKDRCAFINTVKTQVRYIFQKVGVRSKVSLARRIGELL